jgi:hypothetical protein
LEVGLCEAVELAPSVLEVGLAVGLAPSVLEVGLAVGLAPSVLEVGLWEAVASSVLEVGPVGLWKAVEVAPYSATRGGKEVEVAPCAGGRGRTVCSREVLLVQGPAVAPCKSLCV